MKQLNEYINPYAGLPEAEIMRTSINVATKDAAFLRGLHGRPTSLQTTLYILLRKLINELQRANILTYDPAAFEHAVANCHISLPDDSNGVSITDAATGNITSRAEQAVNRDDRPGTLRMAREAGSAPSVASDAPRALEGTGSRRRGKKTVRED